VRASVSITHPVFTSADVQSQLSAALEAKRTQVDAVTAEYNAVKEKHTAMQNSLASSEDLLQTLLTGLAGTSAQSAGGVDVPSRYRIR
jgi:structural maintenance of chromosome 2